ncbi:MAG: hypothetical protein NC095_10025 [Muribaculum sp.]|nr:hypothetical protein [Muribaculum sp.]
MKKILLTLAATAMCTTAFAGTRILYQQNFETAADVAATGWSYGGGSISIASDEYGKFLELSLGQNNGRTGYVDWGTDIFLNADGGSVLEDGTYKVKFDFSIKTNSNNQYNSEITLFTTAKGTDNQPFRGRWSGDVGPWNNFLFDAYQANTAADTDMTAAIDAPYKETVAEDGTVSYSVDLTEAYTLQTGNWYTVECDVDVNARTVDYTVVDLSGNMLTSGTLQVPETSLDADKTPVSMYAQGLWVMTARYGTIMDFDNIEVSYESEQDVANPPTVAMTRLGKDAEDVLNLNLRAYTITFLDGETLHVTGTDGQTTEVEWADCDGAYVYETTTSGTLKAWTTCGTATSEVVEMQVECVPVVLPTATATISAVEAGFGKTYTLSVSNADVPLQPTIFMSYKYVGKSGKTLEASELGSGATVTVDEEGTLTITTEAYGYQAASTSVANDLEFKVKKQYDFARMSDEEIAAAGFTDWQVLNSGSTSGFSNWTARKRLYYLLEGSNTINEEGNEVWTNVYPFGFISEDNTTNVLDYSEIGVEGDDLGINVAEYELFPGVRVFAGHNVTYLKHVGVTNNATSGGNNKNIDVLDLDQTDFVVYNTIGSYGSDSNHPVCATDAEYYAQLAGTNNVVRAADGTLNEETGKYTVSCPIYRIDTVCTCLTVFAQVGGTGVEGVEAEVAGDNYYYTIDGIRLAEPNRPGLYIHNGKKIIVK